MISMLSFAARLDAKIRAAADACHVVSMKDADGTESSVLMGPDDYPVVSERLSDGRVALFVGTRPPTVIVFK